MDKIFFMKAFCRIVELNNVSRAAHDLGLSPSLLSRELKQTEQALGVSLMARTTRKLTLTDHGQHYYDECKRIIADIDRLDTTMSEGAGTLKGVLKVNMPQTFGLAVIAPHIDEFVKNHPHIDLQLTLDDRVLDMVKEGFDLSIRIRPNLDDSSLMVKKIGSMAQVLCAAPSYLDDKGRPLTVSDLSNHSLLGFNLAHKGHVWELSKGQEAKRVTFNPSLSVNNSLFLRDMIAQGLGVGSLPYFLAQNYVKNNQIEIVLPDYALPERAIYAVTASRVGLDAKAKAFVAFLQNCLGQDA